MAHEAERAACAAIARICGDPFPTPTWLLRPGKIECKARWGVVCAIYSALTQRALPDVMPPREWRQVDGVHRYNGRLFVFELDEGQHFNRYRAVTLSLYPDDLPLAFDRCAWIRRCKDREELRGGGYGKPKPPLFPGTNGRHRQRAYRDALADILPTVHDYLPTLRLQDTDVLAWMRDGVVDERIAALLNVTYGH